ncbi:MAG: class I SAM-dependent methyltransferase [bacterium]|nr:class I SAM-dependent methyltransferase [bacterium]
MSINTKIYDQKFFDNTFKFEAESAQALVPILINHFAPKSVIDIGCGTGIYLAEFAKAGIDITGYDGAPAAIANSLAGDKIKSHDLCEPLKINRQFDLCLCLEVAEHLEQSCASTLVNTLASLSDTIIFTAATPGQGPKSIGHINEQPHQYWQEKFERGNYMLNKKLTETLKKEMAAKKIVWWLTKNLMIFNSCHCERPKGALPAERAGKQSPLCHSRAGGNPE